ncbi:MAG: hypothetical protein WBB22_08995, partial [Anaerolineae bacterium]
SRRPQKLLWLFKEAKGDIVCWVKKHAPQGVGLPYPRSEGESRMVLQDTAIEAHQEEICDENGCDSHRR